MTMSAMKAAAVAALAAALLGGGGCASIVSGSRDDVGISTKPAGGTCDVYNHNGILLAHTATPGRVTVPRSSSDLTVDCALGVKKGTEKIESESNGWVWGNVLLFPPFGTLIGLAVDASTGALNGYDDIVVVVGNHR